MTKIERIQQPTGEAKLEEPTAPDYTIGDRKRQDPQIMDIENKDPTRHYRWVRNVPMQVTKQQMRGYRIEKSSKGGVKTVVESDSRADGAIIRGDTILMSCPRELAEQRVKDRFARSENLLASTTAMTKEAARDKGITVIEDSDHGHETMETH